MRLKAMLAIGFVALALEGVAVAAPIELVTNGDFETGNFTGWTVTDLAGGVGSWFISVPGAITPQSGFATANNPGGGGSYAVTDQTGPGTHSLTQTIVVPASSSVTLSFDYFVNDQSGAGPLGTALDHNIFPTQFATGDILAAAANPFDTGAGVVSNFLFGVGGLPPLPHAWATLVLDITPFVGAGGTFQLRFAESDNQGFFHFGVDNISVLASAVPEPGTLSLFGLAAAFAAYRRRHARQ
jgi:hypothetical protein